MNSVPSRSLSVRGGRPIRRSTSGRYALAAALVVFGVLACGDGASSPGDRETRIVSTEVFPGSARAFAVRGLEGAIEVEGTMHPPCAPFDWYTSLLVTEGGPGLRFGMHAAPDGACTQDVVGTLGYRVRIDVAEPGRVPLEVHHAWLVPEGGADTLRFDGEVEVR